FLTLTYKEEVESLNFFPLSSKQNSLRTLSNSRSKRPF
ncbi:hypothetical protein KSS87_019053, partial [Heliosperma pusillum]